MPAKPTKKPAKGKVAPKATSAPAKPKGPIGAPRMEFDQAIADHICEQLMDGKSLRTICAAETMPSRPTIYKWLNENISFADQYARARETQADTLFDEILDIADERKNDWIERKHFDGADESPQVNGEVIARDKLRIDSRKWMAGKLRPKKYGEKLGVDQVLSVSPDLAAMMERVAGQGKRLAAPDEEES